MVNDSGCVLSSLPISGKNGEMMNKSVPTKKIVTQLMGNQYEDIKLDEKFGFVMRQIKLCMCSNIVLEV